MSCPAFAPGIGIFDANRQMHRFRDKPGHDGYYMWLARAICFD